MNAPPEVSVIIPAHNAASTIAEALASVQAQTLADWELICVDDESTDQTPDILDALAASEPRLCVLRVPHSGPGAARNHGLQEARAGRVAFLDADDLLTPDALEQLLATSRAAGPDTIIAPGWAALDQQAQPLHVRRYPSFPGEPFDLLLRGNRLLSVALVPKHLLGREPFDASLRAVEDWDLWLRLANEGARFETLPRVLVGYRMRRGSRSHQVRRSFEAGRRLLDRWLPCARQPQQVSDALHRWACACAAMAFAGGEPRMLNQLLAALPPLRPAGDFPVAVAHGIDWAYLLAFGPLGQTWRGHAARWLGQIESWLRDSVLAPLSDAVLESLRDVIRDPRQDVDRICGLALDSRGKTRLLVYGLGTNGLGLIEELRVDPRLRDVELCVADDYASESIEAVLGLPRTDPRAWTGWPENTVAIVTANNGTEMNATLRRAGGQEDRDFLARSRSIAAAFG